MKNLLLFISAFALLSLSSCTKWNDEDAGNLITEDRFVDGFDKLRIDNAADVEIVQDASFDIRIEAGELLMPYIKTEITGGELRIFEDRNNFSSRRLKVFVSTDHLNGLTINGSSDVYSNLLTADHLSIKINGSGDIDMAFDAISTSLEICGSGDVDLTGTSPRFDLEIQGSGDIKASSYETEDCYIDVDGSGDTEVFATDLLDVNIDGSGDVKYWGSPDVVRSSINGSGRLIAR